MRSILKSLVILGVMFVAVPAAVVQAQATRTWVSGVGDDANPCSRTAPCKTFAGTISKTAANGEINVLDPGGFGAVTITKPISIRADFVEAGVLASGINGIIVQTTLPTDQVVLEGLDIEGFGTGINGVQIFKGNVIIRRCAIHHFGGNGVNLIPGVASDAKVLVQDSVISNNGGGVNVTGVGGAAATAVIDHTTIETHVNFAVQVSQGGALFLSWSSLIGSGYKVKLLGPAPAGTWTSYGNNIVRGNTDLPTSVIPTM